MAVTSKRERERRKKTHVSDRWTNKRDTQSFGMSVVTKLFVDKISRKRSM